MLNQQHMHCKEASTLEVQMLNQDIQRKEALDKFVVAAYIEVEYSNILVPGFQCDQLLELHFLPPVLDQDQDPAAELQLWYYYHASYKVCTIPNHQAEKEEDILLSNKQ